MNTIKLDKKPILYRSFDRYLRPDERKGAIPGKYPHYTSESLVIRIDGKVFTGDFSPGKGAKFCRKNFGIKPKYVPLDNIDYDELYK